VRHWYFNLNFSFLCLFGFTLFFTNASAQNGKFKVTEATTPQEIIDIVQSLAGPTVTISNVTVGGSYFSGSTGSFEDVLGLLDIPKGLIMTCGKASLAVGPNNSSRAGYPSSISTTTEDFDSDLESVVPGEKFYDLVTIEFDIKVTNTVLSFNYMFGSEEYPEYERQYNDVFGFFINRVGSNDVKNLAVTSNGTPVSVKSINSSKNAQYFVSNGDGSNPAKDFYLQYDGFTKKLVAKTEVVPCATYHIKLAISDARDNILDSGVFIEEGSFKSTSKLDIDLEFEHPEYQYAVEGCNKGYFVIKKNPEWITTEEKVILDYTIGGSANFSNPDKDYISNLTTTSGTIIIEQNKDTTKIVIEALPDNITPETETVTLTITLSCDGNIIATATKTMDIKDNIDFKIDSKVCKGVEMPINTDPDKDNRYSYTWADDDSLIFSIDCPKPTCSSPSVNLTGDRSFHVHVKDNVSTCETDAIANVTVNAVDAYFKYSKNINYPSVDAFFDNLSTGEEVNSWDFGDGATSSAFEPTHTYEAGNSLDPKTYKITLNVSALGGKCTDEYDTTIVVNPFYIPNVITPNNDPENQQFVVKGIEEGKWDMKIYNRWGTLVFHSPGYNNDWEGDNVSSGVYYFKLTNQPADRVYKGWLQVIK
jgi:gliding motility-associated-like protein